MTGVVLCLCFLRNPSNQSLPFQHVAVSMADKVYVMYHGTPSLENAALIEQRGFKASTGGLLGPGIYVSRDVEKARQYGQGGVIFEVFDFALSDAVFQFGLDSILADSFGIRFGLIRFA